MKRSLWVLFVLVCACRPLCPSRRPVTVPLAAGALHSCAAAPNHTVRCWGRNLEGQLGDGTYTSSSLPVTVASLTNIVELTAGTSHTCARTAAGAAYCWGRNTWGQLGDGTYDDRATPVTVATLGAGVVQIEAGYNFTCALLTGGAVKCWGLNNSGQIGNGTYDTSSGPAAPTDVLGADGTPLAGVERIEAGGGHVCALKSGALYCWGATGYGNSALGVSSGPDRCDNPYYAFAMHCAQHASASEAAKGVIDFLSGQYNTCALFENGKLTCWGDNRGYALGNVTPTTCATANEGPIPCSLHGVAVAAPGGGRYTDLAALAKGSAINFNCGNDTAGDVVCWGSVDLASWSTETLATPHAVSFAGRLPKLAGLAAGAYHVCGSTSDGKVYCWGNNVYGQLGDGSTGAVGSAVRVRGF